MTDQKTNLSHHKGVAKGEGFSCPIAGSADAVIRLGNDMVKALRKLRLELDCCSRCSRQADCRLLRQHHCQVNAAIQAVNEEWNLTL